MTYITEFYVSNVWILLLTVGCSFTFSVLLALCVCGCRKGTPKNDLLGVDGMVKITNPDENVNHLPAVGNYVSQSTGEPILTETDDTTKSKPAGGSNPHRSLPDIPVYADGDARIGSENGVSGDTSSELYATVDDKTVPNNIVYNKRHTLPNGIDAGPSLSQQSSVSQADSNYARLKENPYDQVKKSENPYANLQSSDSKENDESSREQSPRTSWNGSVPRSTDVPDTVTVSELTVPTRSRRSSAQSSGTSAGTNTQLPTSTSDIPAATAVAGRVAASQDLPYMTPPISQPQHFSGDSQDSSRGYTSISVREPLANIMNQTPAIRNRRTELDQHYSTVSDDSDEMYAAIVEPNSNIYTDSSETYAQIQPLTVAEVHTATEEVEDDQYEPAPQPPSVDSLKHVAHVHSRQASSSSCTSSVANLGSPKPEKRQANSPLPPPPAVSPDLYSRVDRTHDKEDPSNSTVVRNLEDMYAKVHKNRKKHEEDKSNNSSNESNTPHSTRSSDTNVIPFQKLNSQVDLHSKKSWSSRESFEDCKNDSLSINSIDSDATSNSKNGIQRNSYEHCYETLNKDKKSPRKKESDTNSSYSNKEHNFEWQADFTNLISGPESIISNDPGYEQLNPQNRALSDIDPNYEVLRPHKTSSISEHSSGYSTIGEKKYSITNSNHIDLPDQPSTSCLTEDGYSVVNKNKKSKPDPGYEEVKLQSLTDEPNYESMPSEIMEDNYATIHQKSTESESDPNYESVKYLDVSLSEPPYERLQDDETKESSDLSEYEQISAKVDNSELPGYELIKETSSKSSENSDRSDSSKMSNGRGDTAVQNESAVIVDVNHIGQASGVLTVVSDTVEVSIDVVEEKEIQGDIFHV